MFNPFSARTVLKELKSLYNGHRPHSIGIQMKRKQLTKTFIMISYWKKTIWSPWFIQKYFSIVRVNLRRWPNSKHTMGSGVFRESPDCLQIQVDWIWAARCRHYWQPDCSQSDSLIWITWWPSRLPCHWCSTRKHVLADQMRIQVSWVSKQGCWTWYYLVELRV